MPDHDFVFALEMSGDADTGRMLGEVCTAVLGHVGLGAPAIAEVMSALAGAVAKDGHLQIVVSCPGAAEWRTTRALPAS